jgi:hypothetical protein
MYFGCKDTNKNCKCKDKSQKYYKNIAKTMIKIVSVG